MKKVVCSRACECRLSSNSMRRNPDFPSMGIWLSPNFIGGTDPLNIPTTTTTTNANNGTILYGFYKEGATGSYTVSLEDPADKIVCPHSKPHEFTSKCLDEVSGKGKCDWSTGNKTKCRCRRVKENK